MRAYVCWRMLTYAVVRWRMLTYAIAYFTLGTPLHIPSVLIERVGHTYADVCWRMLTYAIAYFTLGTPLHVPSVLILLCISRILLYIHIAPSVLIRAYILYSTILLRKACYCLLLLNLNPKRDASGALLVLIYRGSIYLSSFFYIRMLTYSNVCRCMLTYAHVFWRMLTN